MVFRDFEFVNGVEKSRARAREARKIHFCTPRRVVTHAHYKLEVDDAERLSGRSDDNLTQKFSYYVHLLKMRSKIKLRWQWNSVYITLTHLEKIQ